MPDRVEVIRDRLARSFYGQQYRGTPGRPLIDSDVRDLLAVVDALRPVVNAADVWEVQWDRLPSEPQPLAEAEQALADTVHTFRGPPNA